MPNENIERGYSILSAEDHQDVRALIKSTTQLEVLVKTNTTNISSLFSLIDRRMSVGCPMGEANRTQLHINGRRFDDHESRMRVVESKSHDPSSKTKRVAFDFGKVGLGGLAAVLWDRLFGG